MASEPQDPSIKSAPGERPPAPPVHHSSFIIHPSLPQHSELSTQHSPQRLHPLTLLFTFWNAIRSILIPAIILFFVGRGRRGGGDDGEGRSFWWLLIYLFFAAFGTLYSLLHYFTFSYRIANGELTIKKGVLQKTERHIPLSRVQDIRMTQGVLHRLLGVYDVEIETAGGGQGEEASLSVLSHKDAEALRSAIFAERAIPIRASAAPDSLNVPDAGSPPSSLITHHSSLPTPLRSISLRELILAGLTSNRIGAGLAIIAAAYTFLDDLLPGDHEERVKSIFRAFFAWLDFGSANPLWVLRLLVFIAIIFFLSVITSVAGSIVAFYGFTLSRSGEDLHRAHGLFTRRASSLPRRRIQLLKLQEGIFRRMFGLASLHANTAGSAGQDQDSTGLDVLLPPIPRRDIEALLPTLFPDLPESPPDWQRVSPRAIRRATAKGAFACTLLALATFIFRRDASGLWFFALLPPIYFLNLLSYKHLGYALNGRFFRTRRGVWSRSTHIVPLRNIQSIRLTQSPFDRRHGVMKITLDTAGQGPAGTGPEVGNVPAENAQPIAQTLAHKAAETRYRW